MPGYIPNLVFVGSVYETDTTHKIGIASIVVRGKRKYVVAWDTGYWNNEIPFVTLEAAEEALANSASRRTFPWKKVAT